MKIAKNILSSLKYWLNSIDLINYYPNFVNNGIHDISDLIEKMKSNQNLHYICGTTNFLVAKSKDINYACFIDLDLATKKLVVPQM